MRKFLLAVALVLVMAIPAMSAVKPMPMDVVVYYDSYIYGYECPNYLVEQSFPYYICAEYVCVFEFVPGVCMEYAWVARFLVWQPTGSFDAEVTQAGVGQRYHVKGIIFSELPKNIKYQLIIKKGFRTVYKTAKIPVTPLEGSQTIWFDDFTFESPGMYTFTLQVIRVDGTIAKVATSVFVPAPGAEPALEEESALDESIEE